MTKGSATDDGWRARLAAVATRFGLGDDEMDRLASLLALVRDDPEAPTTVTDPAQGVDIHVADSLVALELAVVREASRVADIGAGAGFPGLPLAVALPSARVTLVESTARKCAFLERAVAAARAPGAHIVCARAEQWDERALDLVCARALAPLAVLAEYAAPLLAVGGSLVAWKGRRDDAEEAAGAAAAAAVGLEPAEVRAVEPFRAVEHRHLHVYSKVGLTPDRFPRRPGMARKRPLSG